MKILHLTNMWPSGGSLAGVFVKNLVTALDARGLENEVLPIDAWKSPLNYLKVVPALRRKIRSTRYDLVHAQYAHSIVLAHLQRSVPVVAHFHGEFQCDSAKEIAIARLAQRLARHTIFVDQDSARQVAGAHSAVIAIGVDPKRFFPADRDAARRSLGLPGDRRFVLFSSDPDRPEKNYPLFRETLSRIQPEIPDVQEYVLHGKNPAEVPTILNAMDLLVLTSKFEASPTVVKEAILCNLPVIATDVGDARKSIDGVSHSHVVEGNPTALAAAAIPILRELPRSDGRHKIEELGIDRTTTRVLAFYRKTLEMERERRAKR